MHAVLSGRKSLMVCYSRGNQAMEVTTVVNRFFFLQRDNGQNKTFFVWNNSVSLPHPPPAYKIPVSALSSEGLNGDNR